MFEPLKAKLQERLKPDEYVFDPDEMDLGVILREEKEGLFPVCPRCATRLDYALSCQQVCEKGIAPTVRCPKFPSHFTIIINLVREK